MNRQSVLRHLWIFLFFSISFIIIPPAHASPKLEITQLTDSPDPFSPNSDGQQDTTTITAKISYSGFNSASKLLAYAFTMKDASGRIVGFILDGKMVSGSSGQITVSKVWTGRDLLGNVVPNGKYTYVCNAQLLIESASPKSGDVTVKNPILSVTVSPETWMVGGVAVNSVTTMADANKLSVVNSGNVNTTYSLCLKNPPVWKYSLTKVGPETYILNAAFSQYLKNISWRETYLAVSTTPVRCSSTKFAGDQAGVNVAPTGQKTLFLQFKAPSVTAVTSEQGIELIITAESP
jgi:hypothetical protein